LIPGLPRPGWSPVPGRATLAVLATVLLGRSLLGPPVRVVMAADEAPPVEAVEERFLTIEQAPGAVFPEADAIERRDVPATPELRAAIERRLGSGRPSLWEDAYVFFTARRAGKVLGFAVVIEEIGKHRPITSIVGVRPDGRVKDVAVMVYREGYGGEVQHRRFLDQYAGRGPDEPLAGRVRNVAGATLSVQALNRTVQKGLAVVDALALHPASPLPAPSGDP
jgi:FMN-binding domain